MNPSDGLTPSSGLRLHIDQILAITPNEERRVIDIPIVSRNNMNIRYNSEDIVDDMMKIPNRSTTTLKTSETILPINSEE